MCVIRRVPSLASSGKYRYVLLAAVKRIMTHKNCRIMWYCPQIKLYKYYVLLYPKLLAKNTFYLIAMIQQTIYFCAIISTHQLMATWGSFRWTSEEKRICHQCFGHPVYFMWLWLIIHSSPSLSFHLSYPFIRVKFDLYISICVSLQELFLLLNNLHEHEITK